MEPPPNTQRPSADDDVPTLHDAIESTQPEVPPYVAAQPGVSKEVHVASSSSSGRGKGRAVDPEAYFQEQLAIQLEQRLERIEARDRGDMPGDEEEDECGGDRHRFNNGRSSAGPGSRSRSSRPHIQGQIPALHISDGGNAVKRSSDWRTEALLNPTAMGTDNNRTARTTMINFVAEIMLNPDLLPLDALEILDTAKTNCARTGVSFSEVLAQDIVVPNHGDFAMSGGTGLKPIPGVPPVIWAIARMEFGVGLEKLEASGELDLLTFLMANSLSLHGRLEMMLRRGCMLRADNALFQNLRQVISSDLEYDVGVEEMKDNGGFHALVSISDFTEATQPPAPRPWLAGELRYVKRSAPSPQKRLVTIEWIANARAWDLQIGPEEAWLRLRDGPPANIIEAHIEIIGTHRRARDSGVAFDFRRSWGSSLSRESPKLSFPVRQLYPLSASGAHTLSLPAPCFPRNEWPETTFGDFVLADSEELMLNVTVLLGPLQEREDGVEEDDEWEKVSTSGDSEVSKDALSTQWLLASWSGRDEVAR